MGARSGTVERDGAAGAPAGRAEAFGREAGTGGGIEKENFLPPASVGPDGAGHPDELAAGPGGAVGAEAERFFEEPAEAVFGLALAVKPAVETFPAGMNDHHEGTFPAGEVEQGGGLAVEVAVVGLDDEEAAGTGVVEAAGRVLALLVDAEGGGHRRRNQEGVCFLNPPPSFAWPGLRGGGGVEGEAEERLGREERVDQALGVVGRGIGGRAGPECGEAAVASCEGRDRLLVDGRMREPVPPAGRTAEALGDGNGGGAVADGFADLSGVFAGGSGLDLVVDRIVVGPAGAAEGAGGAEHPGVDAGAFGRTRAKVDGLGGSGQAGAVDRRLGWRREFHSLTSLMV